MGDMMEVIIPCRHAPFHVVTVDYTASHSLYISDDYMYTVFNLTEVGPYVIFISGVIQLTLF